MHGIQEVRKYGKIFWYGWIRGEANVNLMPEHAYRVGRFLGWYFRKEGQECRIIIGKDTRRSAICWSTPCPLA